jgi:hypothetical protein
MPAGDGQDVPACGLLAHGLVSGALVEMPVAEARIAPVASGVPGTTSLPVLHFHGGKAPEASPAQSAFQKLPQSHHSRHGARQGTKPDQVFRMSLRIGHGHNLTDEVQAPAPGQAARVIPR